MERQSGVPQTAGTDGHHPGAKSAKKDSELSEILGIIRAAYGAVNVALIETYWTVGSHLSRKVEEGAGEKGS